MPTVESVTEYEDFTGRTEAVATVDIRSRVTGHLQEIRFKDGEDVNKGDVLFVIDPVPYQHELDRAKASLVFAEAHLARLKKDLIRVTALYDRGAASREELDRVEGERAEAEANVGIAEASRRLAKQNLDWCTIVAPMSGRMSRRTIDAGNLVKADDTILSNIVALDPIDAYFDIDERTLLRIRKLISEKKMPSARTHPTQVQIGLADEEGFSLTGTINFIDNKLESTTGTLRVGAVIQNPRLGQSNSRLLSRGMFVRIRLPIGVPHSAVLVPEEAIGTDQGQKFVYVVNEKSEVVYRKVGLGDEFEHGREIESGVGPKDRVIVSGLQRVRPGVKVGVKMQEPPSLAVAPPAPPTPPRPSGESASTLSVAPLPRLVP